MSQEEPSQQQAPDQARARRPILVSIAQVLFLLDAVFWIIMGIVTLVRPTGSASSPWIIAALMGLNAVVLVAIAWGLGTRYRRGVYYLALVVLFGTIVLSVTDEVGILDLLSLAFGAALLVLLLVKRSWYVGSHNA